MKHRLLFLVSLLLIPIQGWAFPDQEKGTIPPIGFPATTMVMDGDRFLFATFQSNQIVRIDTQTFEPTVDQIPTLTDDDPDTTGDDLDGNIGGMAIQGNQLFVTQDDGDLIVVDLDTITAEPEVFHLIDASLGQIVADTEGTGSDDLLYTLDTQDNSLLVVNSQTKELIGSPISFMDQNATIVPPIAIAFAAIRGALDKVYVTTNSGLVYVVDENATTAIGPITVSSDGSFANKNLPAAAATPDGDFVLVVNASDTVVHAFDTSDNTQIDFDPGTTGITPIPLTPNSGLRQILVTDVLRPKVGSGTDTYAYVTGNDGVSVIDLNIGGTLTADVIDFNDTGSTDDENDPIPVSATPLALAASSAEDGYVYCSQNDESIAIITNNPFISDLSSSLPDNKLTEGMMFTLTFTSDESGQFQVVVGGDQTGNGQPLLNGDVTADTPLTTDPIANDASKFVEGSNRVFVFVTDGDGNTGRDAIDITVDTPPPPVEIVRTNFGNEKVSVTFKRLNVTDIDHYNIYVENDALTVATTSTIKGTVKQPSSGDEVTGTVEGLPNGVQVFIGVEAVDTGMTSGPRVTTFPDGTPVTATPEETVGLAGFTGETGCGLVPMASGSLWEMLIMMGGLLLLVAARFIVRLRRINKLCPYIILLVMLCVPCYSYATEKTPQWWSLEFKAGAWLPQDSTTKDFVGTVAPTGMIEFAFLYRAKLGAELGVGFTTLDGTAVGTTSGTKSGDSFNLSLIPIYNSFVFRADFKEDQLLVPFVKAGLDYTVFRENSQGNVVTGVKYGVHTAAGLQILLDRIEDLSLEMEQAGINDIYFTMEGRFAWINDFGGNGLDLSNITLTGGLLFEF